MTDLAKLDVALNDDLTAAVAGLHYDDLRSLATVAALHYYVVAVDENRRLVLGLEMRTPP